MNWTLKDHGEILEREAADFVSTYLSNYERIWSILIGHKGNGKMAEVPGISEEVDKTRKLFAEHHYTILESIFLMYRIAKKEQDIKAFIDFTQYCELMDNLMAFYSYSGRIKDNLNDCFQIIGYPIKNAPDPTSDIKSFWENRHVILHGKKVPLSIDDLGLYLFPTLSSSDNIHGWDKSKSWPEAADMKKEYVSDAMLNAVEKLCPKINGLLGKLYTYVEKFVNENGIALSPPPNKEIDINLVSPAFTLDASGTCYDGVDMYGLIALENQKKKDRSWKK